MRSSALTYNSRATDVTPRQAILRVRPIPPGHGAAHPHARRRKDSRAADHFMAMFDGPGRAIRCAVAIRDVARRLGIKTRTGLHTGECDQVGDKIGGNAVETGVQVAGMARESEVLVSRTVKDLVAGSGLKFEDRGLHSFGDVLGEWQLFAAQ